MKTEVQGMKITHGMWELCKIPLNNQKKSHCSLFDWQNEVKDTVAADRVRAILGFGTMTFIGAVVTLTSPWFFLLFLAGKVKAKLLAYSFLGTNIFVCVTGCITWIIMSVYFDDVKVDDYTSMTYGWGAHVFRVGVGMTSLCIPVIFAFAFYSPSTVYPDATKPTRGAAAAATIL
ncbi:hypothetical protein ACOMHN_040921 [Nucella lapillus]